MSKINQRYLKALIRESLEQMRSQQAIAHAGETMRKDGASFEEWTQKIADSMPAKEGAYGDIDPWAPEEVAERFGNEGVSGAPNATLYDAFVNGWTIEQVITDLLGPGWWSRR